MKRFFVDAGNDIVDNINVGTNVGLDWAYSRIATTMASRARAVV